MSYQCCVFEFLIASNLVHDAKVMVLSECSIYGEHDKMNVCDAETVLVTLLPLCTLD